MGPWFPKLPRCFCDQTPPLSRPNDDVVAAPRGQLGTGGADLMMNIDDVALRRDARSAFGLDGLRPTSLPASSPS